MLKTIFLKCTSCNYPFGLDFVLGKLEVKEEMDKDDPFPENIQGNYTNMQSLYYSNRMSVCV